MIPILGVPGRDQTGRPSPSEGLQPSRSQEWPAVSPDATYLTGALTSPGTVRVRVFFSGYPEV